MTLAEMSAILGAPELIYSGPVPKRPHDYYALCEPEWTRRFVYLLSGDEGMFIYIGRSWQPGTRIDAHRRRVWWEYVTHLQLFQVEGRSSMEAHRYSSILESAAIRRLDPVFNIAGVLR